MEEAAEIIQNQLPDILVADVKLWPAMQFINFYFMPLNYQVAFNSAVAIGWGTYFSLKTYSTKNKEISEQDKSSTEEEYPSSGHLSTFLTRIR